MRVIKWEPFRDVDDMFDRFFAETMRRWPRAARPTRPAAARRNGRRWRT